MARLPNRLLSTVLIAACLSCPAAARADVIAFNSPFAGTIDPIDVTPFDPALGTLDSVRVSITGTLQVTGLTPQHGEFFFGGFIPVPYAYRVDVQQDFDGAGSSYFDFSTPATIQLAGVATGFATPFAFLFPFVYDIEFTALTDLVGFDLATVSPGIIPPVSVTGTRSAFIDTGALLNQIVMTHAATPIAINGPLPSITSVGSVGVLRIEYRYTPLVPGVPGVPVPEPASLTLIALGVLGRWGLRRRRRP